MADEQEDLNALKNAAKVALLKAIPDFTGSPQSALHLAMAYTVLNHGKLPGEAPASK